MPITVPQPTAASAEVPYSGTVHFQKCMFVQSSAARTVTVAVTAVHIYICVRTAQHCVLGLATGLLVTKTTVCHMRQKLSCYALFQFTEPSLTCTTSEHNRCTTCYIFRHCLSAIFAAERASAVFTFSARTVCSIHCSSHHARYVQHYNCEHYVNGVPFTLSPSTAASPHRQPASVGHPVAAAVFRDTINGTLRV